MPIDKAKKHFLGKDGHERLNCAGSILTAFAELDRNTQDSISLGHGRAPDGECGAYYAAKFLLEKKYPEQKKGFEDYFTKLAGSTKCNKIRKLRKLSCLDCVEKAAEYLHKEVNK